MAIIRNAANSVNYITIEDAPSYVPETVKILQTINKMKVKECNRSYDWDDGMKWNFGNESKAVVWVRCERFAS
jgi:hypothetical protein